MSRKGTLTIFVPQGRFSLTKPPLPRDMGPEESMHDVFYAIANIPTGKGNLPAGLRMALRTGYFGLPPRRRFREVA